MLRKTILLIVVFFMADSVFSMNEDNTQSLTGSGSEDDSWNHDHYALTSSSRDSSSNSAVTTSSPSSENSSDEQVPEAWALTKNKRDKIVSKDVICRHPMTLQEKMFLVRRALRRTQSTGSLPRESCYQ